MTTTCTAPDCPRPARARGLCTAHYQSRRVAGTLPQVGQRKDLEKIMLRVAPEVLAALTVEAGRTGESRYRVAQRWLEERSKKNAAR